MKQLKSNSKMIITAFLFLPLFIFSFIPIETYAAAGVINVGTGACRSMTTNGFGALVNCLLGIFEALVILMIAAAVVVVVFGAFQMMASEEKRESGRQRIYHGIIGLFVMISIWGLVGILSNTFNLQGPTNIRPPTLTPP